MSAYVVPYAYVLTVTGTEKEANLLMTIDGTVGVKSDETRNEVLEDLIAEAASCWKAKYPRGRSLKAGRLPILFFSLEKNALA